MAINLTNVDLPLVAYVQKSHVSNNHLVLQGHVSN